MFFYPDANTKADFFLKSPSVLKSTNILLVCVGSMAELGAHGYNMLLSNDGRDTIPGTILPTQWFASGVVTATVDSLHGY